MRGDNVRRFLKPIFGKKMLGVLFLVLQLALIAFTITGIYDSSFVFYGGLTLVSVVVILFEINREITSDIKLIWIGLIAVFPLFGVFLYVYVHSDAIIAIVKRRLGLLSAKVSDITLNVTADISDMRKTSPHEHGFFNYLSECAFAPTFQCGQIQYFRLGEHMYESLIDDVINAKKYIFIETFIINQNDYMWKRLEKLLASKVKEGVEVRVLFDGMGSLTGTHRDFPSSLIKQGIRCSVFSPVKPFVSTYHNNRDHRKIIIIDGKCAYTGGVNFADEYINLKNRFGHWKDSAIKIQGEAVKGFLLMFFKLWNLSKGAGDDYTRYIMSVEESKNTGGYISAFDDTPVDGETITKNVYLHIINTASEYVYINTPYLILDDDIFSALQFAAKRGVDVRICMPRIPDKWYVFAVGRTYYPSLIKSGVRIFEYTPGFLHAKSTVSDDKRAYIGSANYDFRSLYHNYECGVYIYENEVISKMKSDFFDTASKCLEFTLSDYAELGFFYRLSGRVLKLFSPLL